MIADTIKNLAVKGVNKALEFKKDLPLGSDIEMIEALLAHMQQNQMGAAGGAAQMYDDLQDDDDDEDYDDEDDDDDEEYYGGGASDQIPINMYQNPYGNSPEAADMLQGLQGLQGLQNLLAMGTAGGDMGGMGGPMDGGSHGGGIDVSSFLPNQVASMGAAFLSAAGGLMDGMQGPGGGVTIQEYDEEDDEELTDGSVSEVDEDDECEESEEEDHHMGGNMAMAAAAMGGLAAGGAGMAAMAAMMGSHQPSPHLYGSGPSPHQMMPPHHSQGGSPFIGMGQTTPTSSPQIMTAPAPRQLSSPPLSSSNTGMIAAAAASVAAAAAAAFIPPSNASNALPQKSASPAAPSPAPVTPSPAPSTVAPPMSISSNLGGGTMSRVDPLAALAMGGAAGAISAGVIGKVVSNNNSGGGTALVKPFDHITRTMSSSAIVNKPPPSVHKSMDELNKLSDSVGMARISASPMGHPMTQSVQNLLPPHSQHQQMMPGQHPHFKGHPHQMMMPPQQYMMMRPPMPNMPNGPMGGMPPSHTQTQIRNVSEKSNSSSDRDCENSSYGSGGGKSDTESTQKKTPSPPLVGPGRVSPDSNSSGASSSGSSGRHGKGNSFASFSDLPSATESMRDSDTEHQMNSLQRQLQQLDMHDALNGRRTQNAYVLPGATPLLLETPGYGWSSLVGHENAKEALKNIFMGKNFPEVFDAQGSCRGVLLFGPSGAGKTSLARSLAYEAGGARLIACTPHFAINTQLPPQHGALLIRNMFDHARVQKPCVMLMDEIELFASPTLNEAGKYARAELMAQVRGETTLQPGYPENTKQFINDHVMLVATTASPWTLPEELRRLFAYNMHIKLPGEKQREELFRMFLNNSANNVTGDQYRCVISKSAGYSAADIHTVVRQASYNPPTQQSGDMSHTHPRVVTYDDLASVMTNYRCLYKQEHISLYQKYIEQATHRSEESKPSKTSKSKSGVKSLGSKVAKRLIGAVISVID